MPLKENKNINRLKATCRGYFSFYHYTVLIGLLLSFSSCHIGRIVTHMAPDITDYRFFPFRNIPADPNQEFLFTASSNQQFGDVVKVISGRQDDSLQQTLNEYIDNSGIVAMLVIRNDSILFERYSKGYHQNSIVTTFSTAKSITATLVGVALGEGLIQDVDDPITQYLPELASQKGFDKITIRHLLNMNSGIKRPKYPVLPFSNPLRFYYGSNIPRNLKKLRTKNPPGGDFKYSFSSSTQLLATLITRVTKKPLATYLSEKIWSKIGTKIPATWSTDKKNGVEKAFCCINTTPREFAKFGRLILNNGNWDGEQLIPSSWMESIMSFPIDNKQYQQASQTPNRMFFNMHWRQGTEAIGDIRTEGLFGQYIHVFPKHNTLILTFSKRVGLSEGFNEVELYYQILNQLNNISYSD